MLTLSRSEAWLILSMAADYATTVVAVEYYGATEQNPFMAFSSGLQGIIAGLATIAVIWASRVAIARRPRQACHFCGLLGAGAAIHYLAAFGNYLWILERA